MKLVVFDLDGTLTETNAVDADCFVLAFEQALQITQLNNNWNDYDYVTDQGILVQIFTERFGRHPAIEEHERVVTRFIDLLGIRYASDKSGFAEVPGATRLIHRLRGEADWAIAIATGAWRRSAEFKIGRTHLPVTDVPSAFAEDGPARETVVRTAIDRALVRYRQSGFERIISVGDALWDVKTARNLGLPFLGIARGARAALLRDNGASHVIGDYLDSDRCLEYLNETRAP
jgi:phosphoglycolate phosphatase-like HAD superfamily hydrolase